MFFRTKSKTVQFPAAKNWVLLFSIRILDTFQKVLKTFPDTFKKNGNTSGISENNLSSFENNPESFCEISETCLNPKISAPSYQKLRKTNCFVFTFKVLNWVSLKLDMMFSSQLPKMEEKCCSVLLQFSTGFQTFHEKHIFSEIFWEHMRHI